MYDVRLFLFFVLAIFSSQIWSINPQLSDFYQYDADVEASYGQKYLYDAGGNLSLDRDKWISVQKEKTQYGSFFAFIDFNNATKGGAAKSTLHTRGVKPGAGERTIQGQVDAATKSGNPTVQRNGKDLFRLRSSGHGQTGATATPQNVRNVAPNGKVFTGSGPDRAVTNRDIRELHKVQTGHGTSSVRTRSGK